MSEKGSGDAMKSALMGLKAKMSSMGGDSLHDSMKGGQMKAVVTAKDSEGLEKGLKKAAEMMGEREEMKEESEDKYEGMSKEELIELLKNK